MDQATMARISPVERNTVPELGDVFASIEAGGATLPNSLLTMAHLPEVFEPFSALNRAVYQSGKVPVEIKRLVAHLGSTVAGCQYCATHNAYRAQAVGETERVRAIWDFERDDRFSEAERVAFRFALAGAQSPPVVSDELFAELRAHFGVAGTLELLAVLSLVAFTNRWNTVLETDLEFLPWASNPSEEGKS
jgi:alkylhydroperoxidase family enzyme